MHIDQALINAAIELLQRRFPDSEGIAAAMYQHFVAAKSDSCNLTLADKIVSGIGLDKLLPPVFEVRASCADAAVDLLHVPYEFWSLGLYVVLVVAAVWALRLR